MTETEQTQTAAHPKKGLYPTWADLLAVIGVFLGASLIGGAIAEGLRRTGVQSELCTLIGYVFQFGVAIAFALGQKKSRSAVRPLLRFSTTGSTAWAVLWGTILTFALSVVIEPLIDLFPAKYFEWLQNAIGTGGWAMLSTIVAAPILEEILFRGVIQEGSMRRYGAGWGILIGASLFGVVHLIPPQIVNAFFIGLILGVVYYRTRSLIPVILIHAINNAIAYFTMILSDGRIVTTRELLHDETIYRIVFASAVLLVAVGVADAVLLLRRRRGV